MGNVQAVQHLILQSSRIQTVQYCDCRSLIARQSRVELCHMQVRCWLRAVEALGSESVCVTMYSVLSVFGGTDGALGESKLLSRGAQCG
jgi:hypothetical protein